MDATWTREDAFRAEREVLTRITAEEVPAAVERAVAELRELAKAPLRTWSRSDGIGWLQADPKLYLLSALLSKPEFNIPPSLLSACISAALPFLIEDDDTFALVTDVLLSAITKLGRERLDPELAKRVLDAVLYGLGDSNPYKHEPFQRKALQLLKHILLLVLKGTDAAVRERSPAGEAVLAHIGENLGLVLASAYLSLQTVMEIVATYASDARTRVHIPPDTLPKLVMAAMNQGPHILDAGDASLPVTFHKFLVRFTDNFEPAVLQVLAAACAKTLLRLMFIRDPKADPEAIVDEAHRLYVPDAIAIVHGQYYFTAGDTETLIQKALEEVIVLEQASLFKIQQAQYEMLPSAEYVAHMNRDPEELQDFLASLAAHDVATHDNVLDFAAQWVDKIIRELRVGKTRSLRVLDLGCGANTLFGKVDLKTVWTSLDVVPTGPDVIPGNMAALPSEWTRQFDIVICCRSLWGHKNRAAMLKEAARVMDDDGRLLIVHPFQEPRAGWYPFLESPNDLVTLLNRLGLQTFPVKDAPHMPTGVRHLYQFIVCKKEVER